MKIIKILLVTALLLGYKTTTAQEKQAGRFKPRYTCEEITNIKDSLWVVKMDKKVKKDSLGAIICPRPTRTIDDKHKPLFVVLNNSSYVATIGSELKIIIEQSLKGNNCGKQIEIVTQDEYLKRIESVRYKDPYKKLK